MDFYKKITALLKNRGIVFLLMLMIGGLYLISADKLFAKKIEHRQQDFTYLEHYTSVLEKRLAKVISQVDGAGTATVFVSFESSFESVYASNSTLDETKDSVKPTKAAQKEVAFFTDENRAQKPVLIKSNYPQIGGVLVVCQGGKNQAVKEDILKAVSTAVGISQSKIHVTGGM